MIVPLTLADFLERAEHVYGDREAIVDEPNPPGGGLGRVTYGEFAAMSRSLAAALRDLSCHGRPAHSAPRRVHTRKEEGAEKRPGGQKCNPSLALISRNR